MKHLGINALFLQPRFGGLEAYTKRLIGELARLRADMRISVYANPMGAPMLREEGWPASVEVVAAPWLGAKGTRAVWELGPLTLLAKRRGVDLLHSLAMTAPLRPTIPSVVTLADITWLTHPDHDDALTMRLWRTTVPRAVRAADRVIAISGSARDDIVRVAGVDPRRVDVVHLGHGLADRPRPAEVRERFGLGDGPVILAVSAKKPHKNLPRLIRAVARLPGAVLVVPGNPTPHEADLRDEAQRAGVHLVLPPYVEADELEGLYAAAAVMAFPSLNEGFGIPVLEAMARGVPVACARAGALPEVAGDAALLFDPHDEDAIAGALQQVLGDAVLRERLVAAGRAQQAKFTWERCARETLAVYECASA